MRYCTNCHRLTAGEPLFCNHCGRSFDAKLCPSRHVNPRTAQVCATCGSRDLSTPQPRRAFWAAPLIWLVSVLPGMLLLALSVAVLVGLVVVLIRDQEVLFPYMFTTGLVLAILWLLYLHLPGFIRTPIRKLFRRSKRKGPPVH